MYYNIEKKVRYIEKKGTIQNNVTSLKIFMIIYYNNTVLVISLKVGQDKIYTCKNLKN